MSQEQRTSKNYFQLNGGINTESNELNFPDGFTTDEANYELLLDGARRRRKGLALESGGVSKDVSTFRTAGVHQTYNWRNVGGDPTKNVVVYRKETDLYFADEGENLSAGWASGTSSSVDLTPFFTSGATEALVADAPVTMTHGKGRLIVGGQYLIPFSVSFDATTGYYVAYKINVKARDFSDVEDGVAMNTEPTGTITAAHNYNLRNRGWPDAKMDSYFSTLSRHPAKNMVWWKGWDWLQDTTATAAMQLVGDRAWDETRLSIYGFGTSSAAKGSLFLSPYDTTVGYGIGTSGTGTHVVSTWVVDGWDPTFPQSPTWTITITTATAHGMIQGDTFALVDQGSLYTLTKYGTLLEDVPWDFNGVYTCDSGTTGSTIKIGAANTINSPTLFWAWDTQFDGFGTVDIGNSLTRGTGVAHSDGFKAVEFHDGRMFYAGMANEEWADTIFYSQLCDTPSKFGRCYQEADPTDENFNALVATDGGTIVLPGLSAVQNMVKVRNSLIVLALDGIYEVSGGQRGFFTADGYSVRKLSDDGCNSPTGIVRVEDSIIFTGPGGIYIIAPNQYTGQLEVTNMIEQTIQTLWNQIPNAEQERAQMFYDDALKRVYILYGADGSTTHYMDTALIFDTRIGAWFKYTFTNPTNNGLLCGVALTTVDDPTDGKKAKFFYESDTVGLDDVSIADFSQTGYNDWHGANGPLPYLYTGWDNLGDFQRRRQAPIVTVFSKRTETGYVDNGTGWDPTNESSTLMSAYWDWTNDDVTNKVGATQQVYRHVRDFSPASAADVDGYPVVVTRNKVRGRGRVLQLKFEGATDKDSHILGFTTNYKVSRRV